MNCWYKRNWEIPELGNWEIAAQVLFLMLFPNFPCPKFPNLRQISRRGGFTGVQF